MIRNIISALERIADAAERIAAALEGIDAMQGEQAGYQPTRKSDQT